MDLVNDIRGPQLTGSPWSACYLPYELIDLLTLEESLHQPEFQLPAFLLLIESLLSGQGSVLDSTCALHSKKIAKWLGDRHRYERVLHGPI